MDKCGFSQVDFILRTVSWFSRSSRSGKKDLAELQNQVAQSGANLEKMKQHPHYREQEFVKNFPPPKAHFTVKTMVKNEKIRAGKAHEDDLRSSASTEDGGGSAVTAGSAGRLSELRESEASLWEGTKG